MNQQAYLQYWQVYGRASTQAELEVALRGLDRSTVLRLISAIGFSLNLLITDSTDEGQRAAIKRFFSKDQAAKILANGDVVFHRHQLLFLTQEVIKHCPDLAPADRDPAWMEQLGQVFLMANDRLYAPVPPSQSRHTELLQLILDFLPISEANLFTNALLKMGRSHLMISKFAEARRASPGFFDIPMLFEGATGVQFKTFEALMVAVFTRLVNVQEASKDPEQFGIPRAYFDGLALDKRQISAFFKLIAANPEDYAKRLQLNMPLPNDFRVIRDKPLVQLGNRCFPLDAHSGLEKFETAVYWSVMGDLPEHQQKTFPSFWGQIFEDYVLWLLESSCDQEINRVYKNPKYADDPQKEVCDAIVLCDRTAIFIEIKGNTISSDAKYGSDVSKLEEELEKKYVGTEERRKGIRQLAAAVATTCSSSTPRAIEGVDLRYISTVMPLLITRDDIAGYFGVNAYLNARFKEVIGPAKGQKSITSCVCVCADTLEKLTPYLCDTPLSDILGSRMRNDKTLRAPFFARIGSILSRKNEGGADRQPTLLKDATFAVKEVAKEVFGSSPSVADNSTA